VKRFTSQPVEQRPLYLRLAQAQNAYSAHQHTSEPPTRHFADYQPLSTNARHCVATTPNTHGLAPRGVATVARQGDRRGGTISARMFGFTSAARSAVKITA